MSEPLDIIRAIYWNRLPLLLSIAVGWTLVFPVVRLVAKFWIDRKVVQSLSRTVRECRRELSIDRLETRARGVMIGGITVTEAAHRIDHTIAEVEGRLDGLKQTAPTTDLLHDLERAFVRAAGKERVDRAVSEVLSEIRPLQVGYYQLAARSSEPRLRQAGELFLREHQGD